MQLDINEFLENGKFSECGVALTHGTALVSFEGHGTHFNIMVSATGGIEGDECVGTADTYSEACDAIKELVNALC